MWSLLRSTFAGPSGDDGVGDGVEFWSDPERTRWLVKQGEYIKTWRRRCFVLKRGKLFWFKDSHVTRASVHRGIISVASCLTVKGAEDVLNRPNAFELSNGADFMYFIADTEKENEDWINSIGRPIVQQSRSVTDSEIVDYERRLWSPLLEDLGGGDAWKKPPPKGFLAGTTISGGDRHQRNRR